jgi:hypothetical protein
LREKTGQKQGEKGYLLEPHSTGPVVRNRRSEGFARNILANYFLPIPDHFNAQRQYQNVKKRFGIPHFAGDSPESAFERMSFLSRFQSS